MTIRSKNIGSSAIQPRHFDGTLARGIIPLNLFTARIVGSTSGESWASATTSAGVLSSVSAPIMQATSTTLRAARVEWSSGSAIQIQFPPVILPPDYSTLSSGVLHLLAGRVSAASSDTTPTWVANFYGSTGASAAGTVNATAASSALNDYSIAIPSGALNVTYPGMLTVLVNPTSSQDLPRLYGAWIEYVRTSTSISTAY